MESIPALRMRWWKLLFVLALGFLYLTIFVSTSSTFLAMGKKDGTDLPFGIFILPSGGLFVQDFSYNMLFLRGIHEHLVAHPYLMAGQEEMVRKLLPVAQSGLPHAYSPVSFFLTVLLPYVSNFQAYLVYFILTGGGILLLVYFYLLPKATHPLQIGALLVTLPSICTGTALAIGQTAMLTTVLVGAFWIVLQRSLRMTGSRISIHFALAALLWTIAFKPSVAFVPVMLLVASQSWRPLVFGLGLLLATWNVVANYYGGWWTGLQDYSYLLNHYNNGMFTPFIQFGRQTEFERIHSVAIFEFKRTALLLSTALIVGLHWTRRITLSEVFQLVVWVFILFSPYLLPSEYWILCLLIVEGTFYQSNNVVAACGKLLLLAAIFNVRSNVGLPEEYNLPCRIALFAWLVIELIRLKRVAPGVLGSTNSSLHPVTSGMNG